MGKTCPRAIGTRTLERAGAPAAPRVAPGPRFASRGAMRRALRVVVFAGVLLLWMALAAGRGGFFDSGRPVAREVPAAALVVLDGDTLLVHGRELRLLGADTPERAAPWFRGDQEPWAGRARDFTARALARARRVTVVTSGREDAHGRALGHVLVDGRPLSALLVEAGLAAETISFYGDGGFPELAAQVVAAVPRGRPLDFEPPWRWRRAHRIPE